MKRLAFAACLLIPGLAVAQNGGIIVSSPGPVVISLPPGDAIIIPPFEFEPSKPLDLSGAMWGPQQQLTKRPDLLAPVGAAALQGEAAPLTIEEEGVRMPDQQFTLPEAKP